MSISCIFENEITVCMVEFSAILIALSDFTLSRWNIPLSFPIYRKGQGLRAC